MYYTQYTNSTLYLEPTNMNGVLACIRRTVMVGETSLADITRPAKLTVSSAAMHTMVLLVNTFFVGMTCFCIQES